MPDQGLVLRAEVQGLGSIQVRRVLACRHVLPNGLQASTAQNRCVFWGSARSRFVVLWYLPAARPPQRAAAWARAAAAVWPGPRSRTAPPAGTPRSRSQPSCPHTAEEHICGVVWGEGGGGRGGRGPKAQAGVRVATACIGGNGPRACAVHGRVRERTHVCPLRRHLQQPGRPCSEKLHHTARKGMSYGTTVLQHCSPAVRHGTCSMLRCLRLDRNFSSITLACRSRAFCRASRTRLST